MAFFLAFRRGGIGSTQRVRRKIRKIGTFLLRHTGSRGNHRGPGRAGLAGVAKSPPSPEPARPLGWPGLGWPGLGWPGLGWAAPAGQILSKVHPRPRAGKNKKYFPDFQKSKNPKKIFFVQKNHIFKNSRKNYFSDFLRSGFHFLGFRPPPPCCGQTASARSLLCLFRDFNWAGLGWAGPGNANGKANLTHAPLDLSI